MDALKPLSPRSGAQVDPARLAPAVGRKRARWLQLCTSWFLGLDREVQSCTGSFLQQPDLLPHVSSAQAGFFFDAPCPQ